MVFSNDPFQWPHVQEYIIASRPPKQGPSIYSSCSHTTTKTQNSCFSDYCPLLDGWVQMYYIFSFSTKMLNDHKCLTNSNSKFFSLVTLCWYPATYLIPLLDTLTWMYAKIQYTDFCFSITTYKRCTGVNALTHKHMHMLLPRYSLSLWKATPLIQFFQSFKLKISDLLLTLLFL